MSMPPILQSCRSSTAVLMRWDLPPSPCVSVKGSQLDSEKEGAKETLAF